MTEKETSFGGNVWKISDADENLTERIASAYELPQYLAHILSSRGVSFENVESFINPKLQTLMPDPYVLKDMQKSTERIAQAIVNNEKIAIIGDYDVDGATSTSILTRFFRACGINPLIHIPSREEGYGPSELAFAEFKKKVEQNWQLP